MTPNTARNLESEHQDAFSGERFSIAGEGSKKEFKPVNPFLEKQRQKEGEELGLRLRQLVADALAQAKEISWRPDSDSEIDPSAPLKSEDFQPNMDEPFSEKEAA